MLHIYLLRGFAFASVVGAPTARLQYIADDRVNVIPENAISFHGLRIAKSHRQNHIYAAAAHHHRLLFYCLLLFPVSSCFQEFHFCLKYACSSQGEKGSKEKNNTH